MTGWERSARSHPADVTRHRLGHHWNRWYERFTPAEREAISVVREALSRIADADRREARS